MPSTTFRNARPLLILGGQNSAELSERLLHLIVAETTNGLYRCEATVNNWDPDRNANGFLYFDRRELDFGKSLKVKLDEIELFDGRIMALEARFPAAGAPEINVLAEDRFQDLRMTRRTRTWFDASDEDVFRRIAQEHSLRPQLNMDGPTHKVLAQVNQSDLAFLRERARATGVEVWVKGDALFAKPRRDRKTDSLRLTYQMELRGFTVMADLSQQSTGTLVSGWDVAGKSALQHEATETILSGEIEQLQSGAAILQTALGQRKQSIVHSLPATQQDARAEAEAYFKLAARRFVVGWGVCEGDGRITVGNEVELAGLGPLFSGKYVLTEVRHIFDAHGVRTEFVVERAGIGRV
jgi:Bacteriophage probable baseplate hub protein